MSPGGPLHLRSLEDLDRLALAELDDRLLPAGPPAAHETAPLRLRPDLDDVDGLNLDAEELLDGLPDLGLVGVLVHAEGVLPVLDQAVALLRHHGRQQDFVRMETHAWPRFWTASSAASLTSSERAQTIAATSSSAGVITSTRSRLRNDLITCSSSSATTTRVGDSLPHCSRNAAALFVDGSEKAEPSMTPNVPACAWLERAARNAAFRTFLLIFTSKTVRGRNATPPPVHCGARVVPARALPVPF